MLSTRSPSPQPGTAKPSSRRTHASTARSERESGTGRKRKQSVVVIKLDDLPDGMLPTDEDFNESDWTWTTATPSPVEPMPVQDELWEAVEDGDNIDTDLNLQEGGVDVNFKNPMEVHACCGYHLVQNAMFIDVCACAGSGEGRC